MTVTVDLATLRDRLDLAPTIVDDAELESIRDACALTQASRLDLPAAPGPDLERALIRRVGRDVAARGIPLGSQSTEFGQAFVPRHDAVLDALEAPHRSGPFA